jgi:hypothetical protein
MIASAVSVNGSSRKSSAAKGKRRSRRAVAPLAGTEPGTEPGPGEAPVDAQLAVPREQVCSRLEEAQAIEPDSMHNMHKLHNCTAANSSASDGAAGRCAAELVTEKKRNDACINDAVVINQRCDRGKAKLAPPPVAARDCSGQGLQPLVATGVRQGVLRPGRAATYDDSLILRRQERILPRGAAACLGVAAKAPSRLAHPI